MPVFSQDSGLYGLVLFASIINLMHVKIKIDQDIMKRDWRTIFL